MGLPAVLPHRAITRGLSQRAANFRCGRGGERLGERAGLRGVVEYALAAIAHYRRNPIDGGCDDGQACGHVLENLERRPVEPEGQRTMGANLEWGDADVGGREIRRHL